MKEWKNEKMKEWKNEKKKEKMNNKQCVVSANPITKLEKLRVRFP